MNSASTVMNSSPTTASAPAQRWGIHLAIAVLQAGFVASPALPDAIRTWAVPFTMLVTIGLLWLLGRVPRRAPLGGFSSWAAVGGVLVAVLGLLSVSFGLVAADLHAWTLATAAGGFLVTLGVARTVDGSRS